MIMEWRKSSYSGTNGQCVEAASGPGLVLVRDSKDRNGPVLTFTPAQWAGFAAGVRDGEFDLNGSCRFPG
jgi:predicted secreted Zn-dependent protease